MNINDFEYNSQILFDKYGVLIFGDKSTPEFKEIVKISKNANFKKVASCSSIDKCLAHLEDLDIAILFIDMFSVKFINDIQKKILNRNVKIFLIVENITNELFKLNPDEFIFNPTIKKEKTIQKLIFKNLAQMENEINLELNNKRITEQQKSFDNIFDLLSKNSLITKTDSKGKIIYANEIFQEVSGYNKSEILGKNHSIIKHEKTTELEIKDIWNKISNKEIWSGILRNRTKNGLDYIVDTKIIPELDIDGEIISYLSVQYDITDLVHKNELAKLLMDELSNPILIGQIGKGIINASKEFLNLFGFGKLESFTTKHLSVLELALSLENQDEQNINLFNSNETVTLKNIKLDTNFETMKNFDVIQKRVITPFGTYYIITLNDITVSQKEVVDAKNEAAVKSNFLATMSHEIRTPLNGMIPYVDLLLESGKFNPEQLDYITTIKQSSEGLLRIINDILDFSKIESGKLEIENITFDPVNEFETVIDLYVAKADEKKINLYTYIEPTLPHLIGDPLRIKQIINNLLSNAIKFTPEYGEIIFSVENTVKNDAFVELNIYIKDNGKGISEDQQGNIFTPFSQADNSISRKFGGTGLGLSISNDLAKMMGGNITLQSSIGNGSKFNLHLMLEVDKSSSINKYSNDNKHIIGIFATDDTKFKCEILLLCKYLKAMKFTYMKIKNIEETQQCDVVFVISSGNDNIPYFTDDFTKHTRVITILGSTIENMNKFHSNAIIQMPINGSKIYDAIVDIQRLNKQNEYLLRYTSGNADKYNAYILVAEDNPTNQKLVKDLLSKKHGMRVDIADNGKIAFEMFINQQTNNKSNYDLIFLDIHMPIMDGLEAIEKIREYEVQNSMDGIGIIALTADAIKTHQQQYLEVGFNDFLAKPIERNKFENVLKKYLIDKIVTNDSNNEQQTYSIVSHSNKQLQNKIDRVCENLGLDQETVGYLIEDFMSNWVTFEEELLLAIDALNHDKIREIAHSLKGAAGSLMLDDVYVECKNLEEKAKEGDINNSEIYKELELKIKSGIED